MSPVSGRPEMFYPPGKTIKKVILDSTNNIFKAVFLIWWIRYLINWSPGSGFGSVILNYGYETLQFCQRYKESSEKILHLIKFIAALPKKKF
jgi:hypothetical protein